MKLMQRTLNAIPVNQIFDLLPNYESVQEVAEDRPPKIKTFKPTLKSSSSSTMWQTSTTEPSPNNNQDQKIGSIRRARGRRFGRVRRIWKEELRVEQLKTASKRSHLNSG